MSGFRTLAVMLTGAFTGLLGGLFGKGGSAIATPLLHLVGVSSFAALASPLPATIPSTLIAAYAYHRAGQLDLRVLRTTLAYGVPATVVGAVATNWVGGAGLIVATDVVVACLGVRLLGGLRRVPAPIRAAAADPSPASVAPDLVAVAAVGIAVGVVSGLLGNSGGFLLAPLLATVLHLPLKRALGTSLAAAAVLAVPGTVVHAALGHVDWHVTMVFGLASVPLSFAGARLGLRTRTERLEQLYGGALLLLGAGLLFVSSCGTRTPAPTCGSRPPTRSSHPSPATASGSRLSPQKQPEREPSIQTSDIRWRTCNSGH